MTNRPTSPWRTRFRALRARLSSVELGWLLTAGVVVGCLWGFVELSNHVMAGSSQELDERILLAMRNPLDPADPIGPRWLEEIGRDLTALGGIAVLSGLTCFALGLLCIHRRHAAAGLLFAAILGGVVLSFALKHGFDRPRPALVPHGSIVYTRSFPSGHSMLATVTYLTLGAIVARMHRRRGVRAFLILSALLVSAAVGVSRVYLGVHWPSDVLGGWAVGAGWACLCWLVAREMQRRGKVEPATADAAPAMS